MANKASPVEQAIQEALIAATKEPMRPEEQAMFEEQVKMLRRLDTKQPE